MARTILLLGSGELGKEFVIAAKRLGQRVIAVDSYDDAPAMQVADGRRVVDMLNGNALDAVVAEIRPDIIVPEIEAIRTERLFAYEEQGIHVVPSARAANMTMNRRAIRDLASRELGIKTAPYLYAKTEEEYLYAVQEIGLPCVVKPLMSSSGKGQSTVRSAAEALPAWEYAMANKRGDIEEVIVEAFIAFDSEITLLTVTQHDGPTLFCPPIGHRQERGDYQESWQPHPMTAAQISAAHDMAAKITASLTGAGIWGVEFFLTKDDVYFSELSPRPHDTGMVTLAGTQNLSEFELHARAVMGLPIPEITLERSGASAVILAHEKSAVEPEYTGVAEAIASPRTDIKIFGKPSMRPYRRMGVALAYDVPDTDVLEVREVARRSASAVQIIRKD
jgi:phosphoribosylglycinamide formyltransferase 2